MGLSEDAGAWVEGGPSALVMREHLVPVEGAGEPFFPPTYAGTSSDGSSYCIDTLQDGTKVCLVDSVGSQANRMEPLFMEGRYRGLVPQITIRAGQQKVNLCEVGHRAGDALLRHSDVYGRISEALQAYKSAGDASALAKVAPTSLVFGVWDSRNTQVKAPRIVSSVVRAYDIDELSRSAQYFPPVDYREADLLGDISNPAENETRSEYGFNEAPSTGQPGGIIARGGIRRDVVVNLVALRRLSSSGDVASLRQYILGLALVAATNATDLYLRQGCNLTRDPEKGTPSWEAVHPDGRRDAVSLDPGDAVEFAEAAAKSFGVGDGADATFHLDSAQKELKDSKSKSKKKK